MRADAARAWRKICLTRDKHNARDFFRVHGSCDTTTYPINMAVCPHPIAFFVGTHRRLSSWPAYPQEMCCQCLPTAAEVMDVIFNRALLLIIVPHALLMAGIYHLLMPRNIPLKSKSPGDSPCVSPPAVPRQDEDDRIDSTITRVLLAQVAYKWVEAIGRARLGLVPKVMAACLYDTHCSRIHLMTLRANLSSRVCSMMYLSFPGHGAEQ